MSAKNTKLICHAKIFDSINGLAIGECGGQLKPVHLSKQKYRMTKCLKCGKSVLVSGDND